MCTVMIPKLFLEKHPNNLFFWNLLTNCSTFLQVTSAQYCSFGKKDIFRQECGSKYYFQGWGHGCDLINYQLFLIAQYWHTSNTLESLISERLLTIIFLSSPFVSVGEDDAVSALQYCAHGLVQLLSLNIVCECTEDGTVTSKSNTKFSAPQQINWKHIEFEYRVMLLYF